uniref:Choline transporter-like protein n=1 Tax=Rhabditophanes sp. KR3021 TaxID=114890 RepID=A0AC35U817_9BILA
MVDSNKNKNDDDLFKEKSEVLMDSNNIILNVERVKTDEKGTKIFVACFWVWIIYYLFLICNTAIRTNNIKFVATIYDGQLKTDPIFIYFTVAWFLYVAVWISFVYICALRYFGTVIIHTTINLIMLGCIYGFGLIFYFSLIIEDDDDQRVAMIIATVLSVVILIIIGVYLKSQSVIKMAVELIGHVGLFSDQMLKIMIFPIVPSFAYIAISIIWLNVAAMTRIAFDNAVLTFILQSFNTFVCFWITCIIESLYDLVIAGSFATLYFNKSKAPEKIIRLSFWRSIKFHMGTVCCGSLSIATFKYIRTFLLVTQCIIKLIEKYLKMPAYSFFECCFYILDNFLVYMEKNAFVITAIHGTDFWTSANKSNSLISSNKSQYFPFKEIMETSLFCARVGIAGVCGVCTFVFTTVQFKTAVVDAEGNSPDVLLPCFAVSIGAYYIAALFIDVFEFGARTVYLCYLEDCQLNDGSPEKPFFMDEKLASIFGRDIKLDNDSKEPLV